MGRVLDVIFLGALVLFTLVGVRRGFIRAAVHFAGSLVAAFLASALGGVAAQWIFKTVFRQAMVERINDTILSLGTESMEKALEGVFSSLPDFLSRALEEAGINVNRLQGILAHNSGRTAEVITDSLSPVFIGYLKVLAVIVLFLLFTMLLRVLADLVADIFRLPLLRQVDGALGGVFGFLLALVAIWVLVSAVQVFLPMLSAESQADLEIALRHSLIAGAIIKLNPLGVMFA